MKLALHRETLRRLDDSELTGLAGGIPNVTATEAYPVTKNWGICGGDTKNPQCFQSELFTACGCPSGANIGCPGTRPRK